MRPGNIGWDDVPPEVRRELGMSPPKRTSSRVTAWKDVPSSWGVCRPHGWAWWPKDAGCVHCEGEADMYVQLDDAYYDHPKTLHLISLLGPEADGYPPKLWTWAIKYAKQGVLKHPDLAEVACRWKGEKGKLHRAMVDAGFIEADGVTLHGWMERTGNDIVRYEEKKSRLREKYRNSSGRFRESSAVSELNGTERNGTKLNETNPDQASPGWMALLLRRARDAKVAARGDTLRNYIEAWVARTDAGRVEQILMDPWTRGKTVLEIQNHFFATGESNGGVPSMEDILKNWSKK